GDWPYHRDRQSPELHPAGRRRERGRAPRAAQQEARHPHPGRRKHRAGGRRAGHLRPAGDDRGARPSRPCRRLARGTGFVTAADDRPIATASEIAGLKRRYLLRTISAAGVDIVFTGVFVIFADAWAYAPRSVAIGLFLLLGVNYLVCRRLFVPLEEYF